ncbi:MAG: ECF-type sigma factor [Caldimonas sp.]
MHKPAERSRAARDAAARLDAPCQAPTDSLFAQLYSELHRLARRETARAGPGAPLGATTLLHEAYLDLSQREALAFADEYHFLAYAARAMRTLIIDHVRERGAQKRGGGLDITSLDTQAAQDLAEPVLSDVGLALDELALLEPALAQVVDLKFFCGFSVAEIAALQGVSERTVQRQWEKARTLLFRALAAGA